MKTVTKDQFYATINPLDISPHITNSYEKRGVGYIQDWKLRSGQLVGRTESGDFPFTQPRYFLNS